MSAGEILRKLADIIDEYEKSQTGVDQSNSDADSVEHKDVNTASMISPLQQKQELLKKIAGVDNIYDADECCSDCGADPCECGSDELEAIKRNAGIPFVAVDIGGEENDIE